MLRLGEVLEDLARTVTLGPFFLGLDRRALEDVRRLSLFVPDTIICFCLCFGSACC